MKLIYSGALGTIDINNDDVILLEGHNFKDYAFSLSSSPKINGIGERFDKLLLNSRTMNFSLAIKKHLIKEVLDFFKKDLDNQIPGRLCLNDSYVECYINESSQQEYNKHASHEILNFRTEVLVPLWITEKRFDFSIYDTNANINGFKLPMRFPMSFVSNSKKAIIKNNVSKNTLAKIIFYGPTLDPEISIDNIPYSVKGKLLQSERYEIDQRHKTVNKITASGDVINSFHLRQRTPSVFNPLPNGENIVSYDGTFSLSIILFEGSVTPPWF